MTQVQRNIPHFGQAHIYAMKCESCGYQDADVEAEEDKEPIRVTYTVTDKDDLTTRVVRSSTGTIFLEGIGSIEPHEKSMGFVTNIEGVLSRIEEQIEGFLDDDTDEEKRQKAEEHIEAINELRSGDGTINITIEDHRGHSMIISDDAETEPLQQDE